jgi:hypothetical protein
MASALGLAALVVALAVRAHAACPESVPDCLGAAPTFSIVADKVVINRGIFGEEGYSEAVPARVVGGTCAPTGLVAGPVICESTTGDLIFLAPDRVAVTFGSVRSFCSGFLPGIGVEVFGDVVTGGGPVRNMDAARVFGVVDTTGTDARLPVCGQANADRRSASATLAALAPTRDLGRINVDPHGPDLVLTADPGVNVWRATDIIVGSKTAPFGEVFEAYLTIALDPATESVVINVNRVSLGRYSSIGVAGDPSKVVLNLVGRGTLRTRGFVDPSVLSGDGTIKVKPNGSLYGGAFARRVEVVGGRVQ